jgi:hypothetical protein
MIDRYNMNNVEQFKTKGYVYIKNAIDDSLVNLVSNYSLIDEQQNYSLEEGPHCQIHNSHSSYGDPLMESLLLQMLPLMEENTGLTLHPTYSYYRVYRPGAELLSHTDRPSCEVSTTITFKFDYREQNDLYSWPIYMEGNVCNMNPGDLVIYRGCDLEHWRDKFTAPEGSYHIQAFLHYVDANGPFSDYKWDRRPSIGFLKTSKKTQIKSTNIIKSYITYTD